MITSVVVRSGDDDSLRGSRASPDETQAVGRKGTGEPKGFLEKEHAEVKPQIAEEGAEAEGIVERQRQRLCVAQRPSEPRELVDVKELPLCCTKFASVDVSFEQGVEFSDPKCEPRPAAARAAGTCQAPIGSDAGKKDSD
ncbi:hypothetical protein MRX96_057782 [Rhipicephalus microplus]